MTDVSPDYLFTYGEQEHERLLAQSEVLDPYTRDLLVQAGGRTPSSGCSR